MFWILVVILALCLFSCGAIVYFINRERESNYEKILLKRQIDRMIVEDEYSE